MCIHIAFYTSIFANPFNEKLTDDEFELIEAYGGEIEHFWLDAIKAQTGEEYPSSDNYPAALVVDVATDPNGTVLQMATGDPAVIYVIVPVEGKLRIHTRKCRFVEGYFTCIVKRYRTGCKGGYRIFRNGAV